MASVQRCWRNWLPALHSEPFLNFVDSNTGSQTQNVERSWKSAKERNKRHNGTNRSMLYSYFYEYMWQQRHKNDDLFDQVIVDNAVFWPPV